MFRRETRNSFEGKFFTACQSISNSEISRVVKSDNVSRKTFIHHFFLISEESVWGRKFHFFTITNQQIIFISLKGSRYNFHKSQSVPVFRIHIRMDFKDESCEIFLIRFYQTSVAFFWLRHRCNFNESIQKLTNPEIIQCRPKENRLQITVHIIFTIEFGINGFNQLKFFSQSFRCFFSNGIINSCVIDVIEFYRFTNFLFFLL